MVDTCRRNKGGVKAPRLRFQLVVNIFCLYVWLSRCLCVWVCWARGATCGCYQVYAFVGVVCGYVSARTPLFFLLGYRFLFCVALMFVFLGMIMTRWLLGCPDIALVRLQFCSVPDTIAFYSVGRHHWASHVASYAHTLIPVLWKHLGSVLAFIFWPGTLFGQSEFRGGQFDFGKDKKPNTGQCAHMSLCSLVQALRVPCFALPTGVCVTPYQLPTIRIASAVVVRR